MTRVRQITFPFTVVLSQDAPNPPTTNPRPRPRAISVGDRSIMILPVVLDEPLVSTMPSTMRRRLCSDQAPITLHSLQQLHRSSTQGCILRWRSAVRTRSPGMLHHKKQREKTGEVAESASDRHNAGSDWVAIANRPHQTDNGLVDRRLRDAAQPEEMCRLQAKTSGRQP